MPDIGQALKSVALSVKQKVEQRDKYRAMRKRVIRADMAMRCCENEGKRAIRDVLSIIGQTFDIIAKHKKGHDLALVPFAPLAVLPEEMTGLTTTLVEVQAGAPLAVGAVALGVAAALDFVAEQKAAYETFSVISEAVAQAVNTRKSSCYSCLKKNILSQGHARKRERTKILRRVG